MVSGCLLPWPWGLTPSSWQYHAHTHTHTHTHITLTLPNCCGNLVQLLLVLLILSILFLTLCNSHYTTSRSCSTGHTLKGTLKWWIDLANQQITDNYNRPTCMGNLSGHLYCTMPTWGLDPLWMYSFACCMSAFSCSSAQKEINQHSTDRIIINYPVFDTTLLDKGYNAFCTNNWNRHYWDRNV